MKYSKLAIWGFVFLVISVVLIIISFEALGRDLIEGSLFFVVVAGVSLLVAATLSVISLFKINKSHQKGRKLALTTLTLEAIPFVGMIVRMMFY